MTYTVNQLVSSAFYTSGVVSRDFETVSGEQLENAIVWLNELLSKKIVEPNLIPYEGTTTFSGVVGQEDYNISDLIKVDTLTYIKDSVRYPMFERGRDRYHGRGRVETIESLPYEYNYERELGGCKISMYFLPNESYTFTVTGLFRLSEVSIGQDLLQTLDRFYITLLQFELSERICHEYSLPVPSGLARELSEYRALIRKTSRPLDMAGKKRSTLHDKPRLGWAWSNLGNGFLP